MTDFWEFCKTNYLGEAGNTITSKDSYIDLDISIWLIMGRFMRKKHRNKFCEHIYYVMNEIHKPFNMGILEYDMFEMAKLIPPPSMNN